MNLPQNDRQLRENTNVAFYAKNLRGHSKMMPQGGGRGSAELVENRGGDTDKF